MGRNTSSEFGCHHPIVILSDERSEESKDHYSAATVTENENANSLSLLQHLWDDVNGYEFWVVASSKSR